MNKTALFALAAFAPLALASMSSSGAWAADVDAPIATAAEAPATASEVVVQAKIAYRNRTEGAAPVLDYGLDYFQRFEPLTAGDALKRVPSVAFLSDVLESDGVRLRGLDPGYTQILINGEKVPGAGSGSGDFTSGADTAFFVDRIPAELIQRIEVVRSPSANRSGDAMAGALNIVLRDGYALDGGFLRVGALMFNDDRIRPTIGGVWGGEVGPGRMLVGFNTQGRRNPKEKQSLRYSEPPASAATFVNREDQTDLRNGTDTSFNVDYKAPLAGGELALAGFYVYTDRRQDERSLEFNVPTGGSTVPFNNRNPALGGNLQTVNAQIVDIEQRTTTLTGRYSHDMFGGKTSLKLGYANFIDKEIDTEEEVDYVRNTPRFTGDRTKTNLDDHETSVKLEHERDLGGAELEFGVQYQEKERDTDILTVRNRFNLPGVNPPYANLAPVPGGVNTITETRVDPYVQVSGKSGPVKWEAGLRYETTELDVNDETAAVANRSASADYNFLLPSAHVKWSLTADDQVSASVARTVRRPSFKLLSPALLIAELGENDFIGNPRLKPETAWGLDVGYERRLGRTGVAGVNFFYRDVTDLQEVTNTGLLGDGGTGTFLLTADNTGDGKVWGIEFDLSTPLTVIGLENTGVFLNYSWLDSEVDDDFGSRRFNSQAEYVLNVGFIQDLPTWGAAFGVTYRKQGEAYGRIVSEEVTTTYGGDLEMFLEKRIGEKLTVRLTGSNLLDSEKKEAFNKFDTIADQRARDFAEYELETEHAGPVFQLIARLAF